ncbi:TetR/AcrR family transcriptional regulator [Arthrobacter sp. I2-34]|uniref:TetR/AcrR family transcriptional regulator n=1 Tax=Arthrobacter hankyongi TaxID=2904801 RepID=A0ABS9L1S1_9MICC|nr:TetR/AcrR family transcriptional regulator [Arthrobacter hankyongi]MCG2620606.1 TetR/AcrR family transcriptional regulator [Arthrobacter hankyongi]
MENSAKTAAGGLRGRKRAATRLAITEAARLLTARRGVNGFTVEEVCERAGISRRTFFNYFPTKEDAILGNAADQLPEELARAFADGATGAAAEGGTGALSADLWEDFIELAVGMMDRMALTRSEIMALRQAVMAEPRLLEKTIHGSADIKKVFRDLLARRESLPPEDPRILMAVAVMEAVGKRAGETFFAPENTRSYREILTAAVADLRTVVLPHPLQPREDRS